MQALITGAADTETKLIAAMEQTDPKKHFDLILDTWWPIAELAVRAYARDQAKFDKVMFEALEGHRHFYEKSDGAPYASGMFELRPLAMAVWGKELEGETTVDSDYMPRWIIDRWLPAPTVRATRTKHAEAMWTIVRSRVIRLGP
jgi:hypothetical protein